MRYILFILILFTAFNSDAQSNRTSLKKGIQKCLDGLGDPVKNCFVTTDINGEQMYIDSATMASMFSGGSGDDWGSQVIEIGYGLTGDGTTGNELEVDTATGIASEHYVDSSLLTVGGITSAALTISPAQITSDQDDYNPTGFGIATYVILSSNNIWTITSFVDSTGGVHHKTLINGGDSTIILVPEHPDGTATNRLTGLSSDFKLYPGKSVDIFYDGSRWRVIGAEDENGRTGVFYEMSARNQADADQADVEFVSINGGVFAHNIATATVPGAAARQTGTATNGGGSFYFAENITDIAWFGSAHIYTEALISIPVLSDGTESFIVELQLSSNSQGTALTYNNTIGIRYSHDINSGEWELYSKDNASAETPIDLNVAVSADALYKVHIEHDKANAEARAYINDVYVGRVTTTMPTSIGCSPRLLILKSAGTTNREINMHSFSAGAIYK